MPINIFDYRIEGQMTQNLAGLGEVNLLNIGYQDNAMPADVYRVNLKLDDPSDS